MPISKHKTGRNSKRTGEGAGLVLYLGLSLLKCVYTHRRAREHFRLAAPFELWCMVTSGLVGPLLVLGVVARPTRARPAVSSSLKSTPWMAWCRPCLVVRGMALRKNNEQTAAFFTLKTDPARRFASACASMVFVFILFHSKTADRL